VVRSGARLQADPARRQVGEGRHNLSARQALPEHDPAVLVDTVHLDHVLGDV
jgi:hypothetical protein